MSGEISERVTIEIDRRFVPAARSAQTIIAALIVDAVTQRPWATAEMLARYGIRIIFRNQMGCPVEAELTEGSGFWRNCSGCQESVDGVVDHRDYPYHPVFKCHPGAGCSECGGIGVVWDNTDYTGLAAHMEAEDFADDGHPDNDGRPF